MIYFVTYDLKEPGQRYNELIEKIKSFEGWAKLGESCYLIKSDEEAVAIRNNLKMVLDSNDKIYVGQTSTPAAWYNLPTEVSKWIKDNL